MQAGISLLCKVQAGAREVLSGLTDWTMTQSKLQCGRRNRAQISFSHCPILRQVKFQLPPMTISMQLLLATQPFYTTRRSLSGSDKSTPSSTPFPATEAAKLNFGVKVAVLYVNWTAGRNYFYFLSSPSWWFLLEPFCSSCGKWKRSEAESSPQFWTNLSTCNEKGRLHAPMSSLVWGGWKDSRKTAKWRQNVSRDCRCVRENYNVVSRYPASAFRIGLSCTRLFVGTVMNISVVEFALKYSFFFDASLSRIFIWISALVR